MFDLWKDEPSDHEVDSVIDNAAEMIRKRKLEAPAIMALEMHKPLAFLGGHAAVAFSPFLVPFFGFDKVNDYSRVFAKRENVEKLLRKLEEKPDADGPSETQ